MLGDDFSEKFDVTISFFSRISIPEPEPGLILFDIEIGDRVDIGALKGFENKLTDDISLLLIITNLFKVENFYGWIVVYNLYE